MVDGILRSILSVEPQLKANLHIVTSTMVHENRETGTKNISITYTRPVLDLLHTAPGFQCNKSDTDFVPAT